MIDCHCHLVDEKFKDDVADVIKRAKEAGVTRAVVLPEYPSQFQAIMDLKHQFPDFVIAGIGAHPIQKEKRSVRLEDVPAVGTALENHRDNIGCIGEIGMDFTTDLYNISEDDRAIQEKCFRAQIQFAKKYDLPVNCHSRTAYEDTIRILLDEEVKRAVLHAFGGPISTALKAVEAGFFFSIPPSFSVSEKRRPLVEALPLDNLLLETDSPVLGTKKGERNEPKNCIISAKFIAEVKGITVEQVQQITTENAARLFKFNV